MTKSVKSLRYLASFGIVGIAINLLGGGYSYQSINGLTSIELSPWALLSWIFFLLTVTATQIGETEQGAVQAPWWRKSISFLYDFYVLFCFLFIPVAVVGLIIETGGFPPPWSVEESMSTNSVFSGILFAIMFILLWGGMGLALHSRIRTPGMILTNIDLRANKSAMLPTIMFLGVFRYYGVFIPIFNVFAPGIKVESTVRGN